MSALPIRRVVVLNVLFVLLQITSAYVPQVTIEALLPKGLKASIPDDSSISLFVFNGNVNRPIDKTDVGTINIEVTQAKDGRWTAEDDRVELKVGDVVNYYLFVSANRTGYLNDNLSFKVETLVDPFINQANPTPRPPNCKPTVTRVRGGSACAGQTIFEDNFNTFREDVWQIEQYIPSVDSPEYPFVSYQRLFTDPTVSVANGNLRIKTKLQVDMPGFSSNAIYTGTLDLFSGCTADACSKTGWGANILPPIVSGKITSKGFVFTYGTVYIRAKLPQGDWLYPDILLEPFLKKYGSMHYSSGVIKIASARGNKVLKYLTGDYSNKVLFGGPIMNYECHDMLLNTKQLSSGQWGDDFHVYAVRWEPERITLLVDDVEWARVEPTDEGLQGKFPPHCKQLPRSVLTKGNKIAPFDDFFYLTLAVSAGGVTEFPDKTETTGGEPKPWRNGNSKAMRLFWGNEDKWYPTWNQPEMLVDYVKVVAL